MIKECIWQKLKTNTLSTAHLWNCKNAEQLPNKQHTCVCITFRYVINNERFKCIGSC